MATINSVTQATKNAILRKSAQSLPLNPSEQGYSSSDIRNAMIQPILDTSNSAISEIERIISEANAILSGLQDKIIAGTNITIGADGKTINAVIPNTYRRASEQDIIDNIIKGDIEDIEALLPSEASSSNKLADKAFVNSSIATNTADYISNNGQPFTSVAQLEAYSGTVTHNDYAFVTGIDESGNTYYDRYKASVSGTTVTWAKEYRLNNSSFTAAQWSAITSGITAVLVASYNAHLLNTNNPHNVTKEQLGLGNVDNTSDLNKPISTAMQSALNAKQNEINPSSKLSSDYVTDTNKSNKFVTESEKAVIESAIANSGIGYKDGNNADHKISSDMVTDTGHTNKFVTESDKTAWNGKQSASDNSLETTDKTIVGAINEVNSLARQRSRSAVFSGYSELISAITNEEVAFTKGNNVFFVQLDIPDIWVAKVESTWVSYTYTTDEAFISAMTGDLTTTLQIGYYRFCKLEGDKVNLANVVKSTSVITTSGSGNAVTGMTIDSSGNVTLILGSTFLTTSTVENVLDAETVRFDEAQALTDTEKAQARTNINAETNTLKVSTSLLGG